MLQARDELEGEFLELLLAGTFSSESAVRHRAERLGFDLSAETVVMVARPDGGSEQVPRVRGDQLVAGAQGWIRRRAPAALATLRQRAVAAVVPMVDGQPAVDLRRLAADLRLECAGSVGGEVSVGLGRPKPGIAGVRASYREAEQALTMGTRLFGGARVVAFADLGLYRLLYAMNGQTELREFFDDQVQALVEYDQRTGAGLMATLDAFFRCPWLADRDRRAAPPPPQHRPLPAAPDRGHRPADPRRPRDPPQPAPLPQGSRRPARRLLRPLGVSAARRRTDRGWVRL